MLKLFEISLGKTLIKMSHAISEDKKKKDLWQIQVSNKIASYSTKNEIPTNTGSMANSQKQTPKKISSEMK